jgi:hypothetical protein
MPTDEEKKEFLQKDLYNELRWLFLGAITWQAAKVGNERCPNQSVLGLDTVLLHARALYDFYFNKTRDGARSCHFASGWCAQSLLYSKYMANGCPANKRAFHLVYYRSNHAGGQGHEGPDHLNQQVLEFAKDLKRLSREFVNAVDTQFRDSAQLALEEAASEAQKIADEYKITNPLP